MSLKNLIVQTPFCLLLLFFVFYKHKNLLGAQSIFKYPISDHVKQLQKLFKLHKIKISPGDPLIYNNDVPQKIIQDVDILISFNLM